VITDLAILRFDDATGEMYLDAVHPGVGVEHVLSQTGWPLQIAARSGGRSGGRVGETPAPTAEEMRALSVLRASRPS
jgi:glutaconate CoA-transferase subunit B